MTRINLLHPSLLADQHLFAEFREIKMVPMALRRSLASANKKFNYSKHAENWLLKSIPKEFTLNTGHVCFFYDKGDYLRKRYDLIKDELDKRGINYNKDSLFDQNNVFDSLDERFNRNYLPTDKAICIIKERISEKIAMKPKWYKYYGEQYES